MKKISVRGKVAALIVALALIIPVFGGFFDIGSQRPASASLIIDKSIEYKPQIQLPVPGSGLDQKTIAVGDFKDGRMTSDLLAKYIKAVYDYGIMIAGILAAIVLMGGGILWLTSGGNDSRITQAKEMIIGSLTGLAILFTSWVLLNTINPELLKMKTISLNVVTKIEFGCCESNNKAFIAMTSECELPARFFKDGKMPNISTNKCETPGCCIGRFEYSTSESYECAPSFQNHCVLGEFKQGACSNVCPKDHKIVSCTAGSNGESCSGSEDGYCYGGTCWYGIGRLNEPCGNEIGAKCMHRCPIGYTWDKVGGRNCSKLETALVCCHPIE